MTRLDLRLALPDGPWVRQLAPGGAERLPGRAAVAAMVGTDRARAHRIRLDGQRLDRLRPAGRVRHGLGVVSGAVVAPDVSVGDQLAAVGGRRPAATLLSEAPLLAGRHAEPAGLLSGGERRMLAWLRMLAAAPRAVVLDAAATGFDPATLRWAADTVASLRARGVCVLARVGRNEEEAWLECAARGG